MQDNLTPWPNLCALLDHYLGRLERLPTSEVEKSWLYRASRSALQRPEMAAHFAALELAASHCDESAKEQMQKRFAGTLPRQPKMLSPDYDDRLLDVMVEVAAYGWMRREFPEGRLHYVQQLSRKTPDLELGLGERLLGIECKNIHMSTGVRNAFDAGQMVSGNVDISAEFEQKVKDTIARAQLQLETYTAKIIFLNYTPDPALWPIEFEVEALFEAVAPADTMVVVFRNYDWTEPQYTFNARNTGAN